VIRRAKHAVFRLSSGHRLIVQPRMTGSLVVYDRALTATRRSTRCSPATIDDGRQAGVPRRAPPRHRVLLDETGWGAYTSVSARAARGTFTPFVFAERLKGTRAAIKKAIMDQRRNRGVGDIYANEALFEAGIDPSKPPTTCPWTSSPGCNAAVTDVLGRAVNSSGTTVRDYRTGTGSRAGFSSS